MYALNICVSDSTYYLQFQVLPLATTFPYPDLLIFFSNTFQWCLLSVYNIYIAEFILQPPILSDSGEDQQRMGRLSGESLLGSWRVTEA